MPELFLWSSGRGKSYNKTGDLLAIAKNNGTVICEWLKDYLQSQYRNRQSKKDQAAIDTAREDLKLCSP